MRHEKSTKKKLRSGQVTVATNSGYKTKLRKQYKQFYELKGDADSWFNGECKKVDKGL